METIEVFLILPVTFIIAYLYMNKSKAIRSPPGPKPFPLIGNALQVGKSPHLTFMRWAKEYGPIVQFKLGMQNWLLINDPDLIEELYNHPNAMGKENGPIFFEGSQGHGLNFASGPVADAHRKFTVESLNALRLAKSFWEDRILQDANILLKWLQTRQNRPVFGQQIFFDPFSNTLWSIMSGHKQDWSKRRSEFVTFGDKVMATIFRVGTNGLLVFPLLRFIFPEKMGWNTWVKQAAQLRNMCEDCIVEHLTDGQYKQLRDFTDYYLSKLDMTKDPKSPFYGNLGRKNLVSVMLDIYTAGQIPSSVLAWALLYLSQHQSVQTKLQEEIDINITENEEPGIEQRKRMPYAEAILFETLRLASASPIGNPHRLLEDMEFHGYALKKNTILAPNFFWVHHDPNLWKDPDVFRPERFVENEYKKFFPFSVGKTKCVGEALAMDAMFLYLIKIFKAFRVTPQNSCEKMSLVPQAGGIILHPMPFKVIFAPRF